MNRLVYLAGPITAVMGQNQTHEQIKGFRDWVGDKLFAVGFMPVDPFRGKKPGVKYTSREIVDRDLADVRACDILLLLPGWQTSYGTIVETTVARDCGHLIVAVGGHDSPFFDVAVSRVVDTVDDAITYLKEFIV